MSRGLPAHVVIAGAGLSGSALALTLLRRGLEVTLLSAERAVRPAVEALPEPTVRLLQQVGLAAALRKAGGVVVRGFEGGWEPGGGPRWLDGWWVHVERSRLAQAALAEAIWRGARVVAAHRASPAQRQDGNRLCWRIDGSEVQPIAVVDATGRVARWSRPLARAGRQVAALFNCPGSSRAEPGRRVRIEAGWAYRIAHPDQTTVGIVLERGALAGRTLPAEAAAALGVAKPQACVFSAHRPAFAQWAEEPIRGRRLAIGDAALAYDPIAGQGLRFGLASGLAAAAVISAWAKAGDPAVTTEYYRTFAGAARQRHLRRLAELRAGGTAAPVAAVSPAETFAAERDEFFFAAPTRRTSVNRGGRLATEEALVLADGEMVRWLGAFDLLRLRDLARTPRHGARLRRQLVEEGLSGMDAGILLHWCLRHGVLARRPAGR
jgi:2-polyprenyl-6-methoxyphenol hydroxylase-like FAD-dependent oxidoreductase